MLADDSSQVLRDTGANLVASTLLETRMYLAGLAILDFQAAECLEQLLPDDGRESVSGSRGVHQTLAFVASEDERVERLRSVKRLCVDRVDQTAWWTGSRPSQKTFLSGVELLRSR